MKRRTLTRTLPRLVLTGAIGTVLASCGGGGSNDGPGLDGGGLSGGDENRDGIPDVTLEGIDQDNDGVDDVDVNGDGRPDFDFNQDGIRDTDVNNDGSIDPSVLDDLGLLAGFDTDGDGVADIGVDGQPIENTPVAGAPSCPNGGSDATSSNDQWNDNCTLRRGNDYDSYYTRGVQRILYCLGFDSGSTTIGGFADAEYGEATVTEVRAYQDARNLTADGVIGPQTWDALRNELVALPITRDNRDNGDRSYAVNNAVNDASCTGQVQFYRSLATNGDIDSDTARFDGWSIADNPGRTGRVEFSIRNPFR